MIAKSCKLAAVLLAAAALMLAGSAHAQQSDGSPDGLYVQPDLAQAVRDKQEAASNRQAQAYMESLDPEAQQIHKDVERVKAANKETVTRNKLRQAADKESTVHFAESVYITPTAWVAILASAGLLVSLVATGAICWSHMHRTAVPVRALMPGAARPPVPAGASGPAGDKQLRTARLDTFPKHSRHLQGAIMSILKRVARLSTGDLQDLQEAILEEIQRRKELAAAAEAADRRQEAGSRPSSPADDSQPRPKSPVHHPRAHSPGPRSAPRLCGAGVPPAKAGGTPAPQLISGRAHRHSPPLRERGRGKGIWSCPAAAILGIVRIPCGIRTIVAFSSLSSRQVACRRPAVA